MTGVTGEVYESIRIVAVAVAVAAAAVDTWKRKRMWRHALWCPRIQPPFDSASETLAPEERYII